MEESGSASQETGWTPQHLALRRADSEELLAVAPAYAKMHSLGEFVFDQNFADASHSLGRPYYPKLLVGVPFTPATGRRVLTADADAAHRPQYLALLAKAIVQVCDAKGMGSAHVNFCEEDEVAAFKEHGYCHRLGLQYQWSNCKDGSYACFDDFLNARFPSKKRIKLKRERAKVRECGVELAVLAGDTLSAADVLDVGYEVYVAGIDKQWLYGRQYLNRRFFELLSECTEFVDNNIVLVTARDESDKSLIAGTFNIVGGKDADTGLATFYGRYWGSPREMSGAPAVRGLHFEACYYQSIEYAIKAGIGRVEPGAGGGESKNPRGFEATATSSCHFFREPELRRAIGVYIESERSYILGEMTASGD